MEDALLLQQATAPVAFYHRYITPFSPASSSRPNCKSTGILSDVQWRVTVPRLTAVEFLSEALLWGSFIYF